MPAPTLDGTTVLGEAINTSGTHTFASGKTTTGSNRLGIVAVGGVSFGTSGVSGVTWNGVAMTLVDQLKPDMAASLWYIVAPPTGSSTVAITFDGLWQGYGIVSSFQDVNQTTPIGTAAKTSGTGETASLTVSSASGETVVDALGCYPNVPTVGAGQTVIGSVGSNSGGDRWGAHSYEAGAASVSMGWSGAGITVWSIVGVSLKAVVDPTNEFAINTLRPAIFAPGLAR